KRGPAVGQNRRAQQHGNDLYCRCDRPDPESDGRGAPFTHCGSLGECPGRGPARRSASDPALTVRTPVIGARGPSVPEGVSMLKPIVVLALLAGRVFAGPSAAPPAAPASA